MFNKFLVHRIGSLKVLSDTKLILDNQGGLIYDQVGTIQILQRFHFQRISYSTNKNWSRPEGIYNSHYGIFSIVRTMLHSQNFKTVLKFIKFLMALYF